MFTNVIDNHTTQNKPSNIPISVIHNDAHSKILDDFKSDTNSMIVVLATVIFKFLNATYF